MNKAVKEKLRSYYLTLILELGMMLGACIYLKLYDRIIYFCIAIVGFSISYIIMEFQGCIENGKNTSG